MSEKNATPWGTPGTPGQGITNAKEPKPTLKPVPDSKVDPNPPHNPSVFLNPQQQQENVAHAQLLRADHIYRSAIGLYNGALDNWRAVAFATGKATPAPIFAVSFAAQINISNVSEELNRLPFAQVAALYPLPEVK